MFTEIASSTLATIAYRLASEPTFAQTLRELVDTRMLNGQVITDAEIAAIKSLLDLGVSMTSVDGGLGVFATWLA